MSWKRVQSQKRFPTVVRWAKSPLEWAGIDPLPPELLCPSMKIPLISMNKEGVNQLGLITVLCCLPAFWWFEAILGRKWEEGERWGESGWLPTMIDAPRPWRPIPLSLSPDRPPSVMWQREKINGQDFSARTRVRGYRAQSPLPLLMPNDLYLSMFWVNSFCCFLSVLMLLHMSRNLVLLSVSGKDVMTVLVGL